MPTVLEPAAAVVVETALTADIKTPFVQTGQVRFYCDTRSIRCKVLSARNKGIYFILSIVFIIGALVLFVIPMVDTIVSNIVSGHSFVDVVVANLSVSIAIGMLLISRFVGISIKIVKGVRKGKSRGYDVAD
jgi:hypothetical protein